MGRITRRSREMLSQVPWDKLGNEETPCNTCNGSGKCRDCEGMGRVVFSNLVKGYEIHMEEIVNDEVSRRMRNSERTLLARAHEEYNIPENRDPRDTFPFGRGPWDHGYIDGIHTINEQRGTSEDIKNFVDGLHDFGGIVLADSKYHTSHLSRRQGAIVAAIKDNVPLIAEKWKDGRAFRLS